eukprot:3410561-Pleurochrysis_carterae.AAC.1
MISASRRRAQRRRPYSARRQRAWRFPWALARLRLPCASSLHPRRSSLMPPPWLPPWPPAWPPPWPAAARPRWTQALRTPTCRAHATASPQQSAREAPSPTVPPSRQR